MLLWAQTEQTETYSTTSSAKDGHQRRYLMTYPILLAPGVYEPSELLISAAAQSGTACRLGTHSALSSGQSPAVQPFLCARNLLRTQSWEVGWILVLWPPARDQTAGLVFLELGLYDRVNLNQLKNDNPA